MNKKSIGVITAVQSEAQYIEDHLSNTKQIKKGLYTYITGTYHCSNIILLIGGATVINTAIATNNLIEKFEPSILIFTGSSGALETLHVGDVLIADKAYYFDLGDTNKAVPEFPDFGNNPVTGKPDSAAYNASPELVSLAEKSTSDLRLKAQDNKGKSITAQIYTGPIATTFHFPNNQHDIERMKKLDIKVTAMETASFYNVCQLYHKPCIAFRGVSNLLLSDGKHNEYTDWNKANEKLAVDNAAKAVLAFIDELK